METSRAYGTIQDYIAIASFQSAESGMKFRIDGNGPQDANIIWQVSICASCQFLPGPPGVDIKMDDLASCMHARISPPGCSDLY